MQRMIAAILARATCVVACAENDHDQLVGFAAYTPLWRHGETSRDVRLDYVYVKRDFRKTGIARAMLKDVPISCYAFRTPNVRPPPGWRYHPRLE